MASVFYTVEMKQKNAHPLRGQAIPSPHRIFFFPTRAQNTSARAYPPGKFILYQNSQTIIHEAAVGMRTTAVIRPAEARRITFRLLNRMNEFVFFQVSRLDTQRFCFFSYF